MFLSAIFCKLRLLFNQKSFKMVKETTAPPPRRLTLNEAVGQVESYGKMLIRQLEIFEGNHVVFRRLRKGDPLIDYHMSGLLASLRPLILYLKASGEGEKLEMIRIMLETARITRVKDEYVTGQFQEFVLYEKGHFKESLDSILAYLDA